MTLSSYEVPKFAIRGSVTESSANTYTEAQIITNIGIESSYVFMATGCYIYLDTNGAIVDADEIHAQLTYTSQSALIAPGDADWILGRGVHFHLTTSGGLATPFEETMYYSMAPYPIAQNILYWGVRGLSLANAGTAAFKLEGFLKKVSSTDFLRITRSR